MKKYLCGIAAILAIENPILAQREIGVSVGNYNTLNNLYINPKSQYWTAADI